MKVSAWKVKMCSRYLGFQVQQLLFLMWGEQLYNDWSQLIHVSGWNMVDVLYLLSFNRVADFVGKINKDFSEVFSQYLCNTINFKVILPDVLKELFIRLLEFSYCSRVLTCGSLCLGDSFLKTCKLTGD